jgi:starch synthase
MHPDRVRVHIGYAEARAHQLIAGADAIAVPSRFEPCGLTQMYGLRYGTVPVVRRVGGLGDTVADGRTGIVFDAATPAAFEAAVRRAIALRQDTAGWAAMMRAGMSQELSWARPARDYLALYAEARRARAESPRLAAR